MFSFEEGRPGRAALSNPLAKLPIRAGRHRAAAGSRPPLRRAAQIRQTLPDDKTRVHKIPREIHADQLGGTSSASDAILPLIQRPTHAHSDPEVVDLSELRDDAGDPPSCSRSGTRKRTIAGGIRSCWGRPPSPRWSRIRRGKSRSRSRRPGPGSPRAGEAGRARSPGPSRGRSQPRASSVERPSK